MDNLPDRIYLDMDETLLLSKRVSRQPTWPNLPGAKTFDCRGEAWVAFPRPHALELITACMALAPTYYLTSGGSEFQTIVRDLLDLPKIPVITWEFYNTILPARRALLVDDNEMPACGIQDKMRAVLPDHRHRFLGSRNYTAEQVADCFTLIQAPYWAEPNFEDDKLPSILTAIQQWAQAAP